MQRVFTESGNALILGQSIGSGGEADVYAVESNRHQVAKIYHEPNRRHQQKIKAMVARPPRDPGRSIGHCSIAWPLEALYSDDRGRFAGYLMPRIEGSVTLFTLFNPSVRLQTFPLFDWSYLNRTALNLASAAAALHESGAVIGDVNESNILVNASALVTLVDTDSFQVRSAEGKLFTCPVAKAEYVPPELQTADLKNLERSIEQDNFGLSILIFQLLMEGIHPYQGLWRGKGDAPSLGDRIKRGLFPYSSTSQGKLVPSPLAPPIGLLPQDIGNLFMRCFIDGADNPARRPSMREWIDRLGPAENRLVRCPVNRQHTYHDHLQECPWCARTKLFGGRDPFPTPETVESGDHVTRLPFDTVPKQAPLEPIRQVKARSDSAVRPPSPAVVPQPLASSAPSGGQALVESVPAPAPQVSAPRPSTAPRVGAPASQEAAFPKPPKKPFALPRFTVSKASIGLFIALILFVVPYGMFDPFNLRQNDSAFEAVKDLGTTFFVLMTGLLAMLTLALLLDAHRFARVTAALTFLYLSSFFSPFLLNTGIDLDIRSALEESRGGRTGSPVPAIQSAPTPVPVSSRERVIVLDGGVELRLVEIRPGRFLMGSPETESERGSDEEPRTWVTLTSGFWMSETEITQAQWESVMETGSEPIFINHSTTRGPDYPVDSIGYNAAVIYCLRLRERSDLEFTLPTEAQWEYACRAGTQTPFFYGDVVQPELANYDCTERYLWSSTAMARRRPIEVASYPPNAWGLYDMHGNVRELCVSWYEGTLPGGSVTNYVGPAQGSYRVVRGGSWKDEPAMLRSAARQIATRSGEGIQGFRIVAPLQAGAPGFSQLTFAPEAPARPPTPGPSPVPTEIPVRIQGDTPTPARARPTPTPRTTARANRKTIGLRDGVHMAFVWIPAGDFYMGSPETENGRSRNEGPRVRVSVERGFWMGETEVTQRQWNAVMGTDPANFKSPDLPVERVTWNEAMEFCRLMTNLCETDIALPAEYQWEYACRANASGPYPFGDASIAGDYAWYRNNSKLQTHPVRAKMPNAWGLYDMHGNVAEWCCDWYSMELRPHETSDPNVNTRSSMRVTRGGSWNDYVADIRSATRTRRGAGGRYYEVGFRVISVDP